MGLMSQPILLKTIFLFLAYVIHGRPFIGLIDYVFAFLVVYFLLFGQVRQHIKPLVIGSGIAFLILARLVPQLHIPEELRLLVNNQGVLTQPEQFVQNPENYPFAITADGYIQGNHNKRIVHEIDIDQGVLSLRTGYINRPEFNYNINGLNTRSDLPYVVCYTLTPSIIGMTLSVVGRLYFERNGEFKSIDSTNSSLKINSNLVGAKLYGFGGSWDGKTYHNLRITLEKNKLYKIYAVLRALSMLMGLGVLFAGLFVIFPTRELALQSGILFLSALSFWFYFPNVFRWGILSKEGKDGIIHDGFPYWMLEKLAEGDWQTALASPERVFYFMPGMRYVRFIEMLLFGDAYILQVCLVIFVPLIFYRFFSVFLIKKVSISLVFVMFFLFAK